MSEINQTINWGIIGCGDVCEVKSGPAFQKADNSKLVAVMRRNEDKAKDFAKRHNVPKYYSNTDDLIQDNEVDAIYIATPPVYHEEYALQSINAGKPVYIEKPLTLDSAACERIMKVSEKQNIKVSGAYYRRELEMFKKVREIIKSGLLGEIRLITIRTFQSLPSGLITETDDKWRVKPEISGGGIFHDLAPHQLDLMYYYFGEPHKVAGFALNQSDMHEATDVTHLHAIFGKDILFDGLWAFNVNKNSCEDLCQVIGEKGKISFPFFSEWFINIETEDWNEKLQFINPPHIQQPLIEKVNRYFMGEGENPCPLNEILISMKMIDATVH